MKISKKITITVPCVECGRNWDLTLKPKTPKTMKEIKKDFEKWVCDECKMAEYRRFAKTLREGSGVYFGGTKKSVGR